MLTNKHALTIIKKLSLPKQDYDTKQRFSQLPNDKNKIKYSCQKEHWEMWLNSKEPEQDFENTYTKILCAPMLYWLAEALDIDVSLAKYKIRTIHTDNDKTATMRKESRIFLSEIPYKTIQMRMEQKT